MQEYAEAFYKSQTWQECRDSYMRSVRMMCERCASNGLITPAEIVHHKTHVSVDNINDPNILLNPDNLELLCQRCHNKEHNKGTRRYYIAEDGRVYV